MKHVFENIDRRPVPATGEITPYINGSRTGLPVEVDDADTKLFAILEKYGDPVPTPDGLETQFMVTGQPA